MRLAVLCRAGGGGAAAGPSSSSYLALEAVDVGHRVQARDQHALLVGSRRHVQPVCTKASAALADHYTCPSLPSAGLLGWIQYPACLATYTLSKRKALPPLPVNCLDMIWSFEDRCVPQPEQHQISGPSRNLTPHPRPRLIPPAAARCTWSSPWRHLPLKQPAHASSLVLAAPLSWALPPPNRPPRGQTQAPVARPGPRHCSSVLTASVGHGHHC